jgi:ubiquinone/menaquinone biosynthesis C-methylase UbiE
MPPVRLRLLPLAQYTGVNRDDPIRFYFYPLLGRMYRRRVEMCLSELTGGRRVLEIGFGTGLTFLNLHDLYDEIHGLDLTSSPSAVAGLFARHGIATHLRQGNVLDMPYPDDTFDSVLLISILEHLKPRQQARAFSEIRRVLRPGGQVVYGVPVERPLMVFAFKLLGYDIRRLHFSTEDDVRSAAQAAMRQVRVRSMRSTPPIFGSVYEVGHFAKHP